MKYKHLLIILLLGLLLAGCTSSSFCPEGSITYLDDVSEFPPDTSASLTPQPVEMTIKGKTVTVDRVIEGPLCNDTWEGTIYVSCALTLHRWEIKPFFFSNGCELEVKPDTVVYVAAHNDVAYYKGCSSCH